MKPDLNHLAATMIMGWRRMTYAAFLALHNMAPFDSGTYGELLVWVMPDNELALPGSVIFIPLTDMNQCMMVVEKMKGEGWKFMVRSWGDKYEASFGKGRFGDVGLGAAVMDTPNKAILTAALRAKGVLEER